MVIVAAWVKPRKRSLISLISAKLKGKNRPVGGVDRSNQLRSGFLRQPTTQRRFGGWPADGIEGFATLEKAPGLTAQHETALDLVGLTLVFGIKSILQSLPLRASG